MKNNVTLIGMPGAGKSTVGVILAKILAYDFVDTDVRIQTVHRKALQEIIVEDGHLGLRAIEETEILGLRVARHVIATGGSAVYSARAMAHLRAMSAIVFLEARIGVVRRRIRDFAVRGIAKPEGQTFRELFDERQALYRQYAEITVDCNRACQEEVAARIAGELRAGGLAMK